MPDNSSMNEGSWENGLFGFVSYLVVNKNTVAKYVLVSPTHMLERLNNNQIFQAVTKKAVIFHMVEIGNFAGFKQVGETQ